MKGVHVLVLKRSRQERVPRNLSESAASPPLLLNSKKNGAQRKAEGRKQARLLFLLPMVPCAWSTVSRVSRSPTKYLRRSVTWALINFLQMGSSPFLVRSARKARRIFGSITSQLENLFFHPPLYLAPLHMSPVYRDCPVSEISPCL